jgi:hypothetical protein
MRDARTLTPEERRAAMPAASAFIDAMQAEFGRVVVDRACENGWEFRGARLTTTSGALTSVEPQVSCRPVLDGEGHRALL